jgi:hypothetical protein
MVRTSTSRPAVMRKPKGNDEAFSVHGREIRATVTNEYLTTTLFPHFVQDKPSLGFFPNRNLHQLPTHARGALAILRFQRRFRLSICVSANAKGGIFLLWNGMLDDNDELPSFFDIHHGFQGLTRNEIENHFDVQHIRFEDRYGVWVSQI